MSAPVISAASPIGPAIAALERVCELRGRWLAGPARGYAADAREAVEYTAKLAIAEAELYRAIADELVAQGGVTP